MADFSKQTQSDGRFKTLNALQRVSAAEIEEMKRFSLFIIFNAEAQRRRVRREVYSCLRQMSWIIPVRAV